MNKTTTTMMMNSFTGGNGYNQKEEEGEGEGEDGSLCVANCNKERIWTNGENKRKIVSLCYQVEFEGQRVGKSFNLQNEPIYPHDHKKKGICSMGNIPDRNLYNDN